jgi:hypothetical protein
VTGFCLDDPLGGCSAGEWPGTDAGHFYSSAGWLRLCAESVPDPTGAVVAATAEAATAAVPVAVVDRDPGEFYRWTEQLTRRQLPAPPAKGLLVGPRRGYQTHLLRSGGSALAAAAALLKLIRAATSGPAIAMYLSTPDVVALRTAGVQRLPVLLKPDAWISVPEGDLSQWLATVTSSRRQLIRRETRKFEAVGYEVEDVLLTAEVAELAGQLLTNTEARYGHSAHPDARIRFLTRQAEELAGQGRVLLLRRPGGEPVGYCLYYLYGETLFLRSAGFDYFRLADAAEYFNLVYYHPLRRAIAAGARWIHAGVEAVAAKALRGAELRPLWLLDLGTAGAGVDRENELIRAANQRESSRIAAISAPVRRAWADGIGSAEGEFGLVAPV